MIRLCFYYYFSGGSTLKTTKENPRNNLKEETLTILFDDLLEVFTDKEAVIKMDIESAECRALKNSTQFFNKVKAHAIFMEFQKSSRNESLGQPGERTCFKDMVIYLRFIGFEPWVVDPQFDYRSKQALLDKHMASWPGDIVWIRKKPS